MPELWKQSRPSCFVGDADPTATVRVLFFHTPRRVTIHTRFVVYLVQYSGTMKQFRIEDFPYIASKARYNHESWRGSTRCFYPNVDANMSTSLSRWGSDSSIR